MEGKKEKTDSRKFFFTETTCNHHINSKQKRLKRANFKNFKNTTKVKNHFGGKMPVNKTHANVDWQANGFHVTKNCNKQFKGKRKGNSRAFMLPGKCLK